MTATTEESNALLSSNADDREAGNARSPSSDRISLSDAEIAQDEQQASVPRSITRRLYVSHFLSTWNSRVFEFGAVLYLASIFPNTLMPMSVYAFSRGLSAFLFSPAVGRYIDRNDRLRVVRLSILLQRLVVALSCVIFFVLSMDRNINRQLRNTMLTALALMACIERLCSVMNLVSVERDWVVVIAGDNESSLRLLNSQMRRIDLVCKLAGPFLISMIDEISTQKAILVNLGMNIVSVMIEYFAILSVYQSVPDLQNPKNICTAEVFTSSNGPNSLYESFKTSAATTRSQLSAYIHHRALRPSLAGALLYLTVLSFGGQMVTYLLSSGWTSSGVAIARTGSVALEISATWLAPWLMSRIGAIRSGIWFLSWQMMCLGGGACVFVSMYTEHPAMAATGLVVGTMLSRVGLWGFDLSSQITVQEEVQAGQRGSFSSIEASLQALFELCSYASTMIFSRPDQFQWPALMSCVAVYSAGGLYASFVRSRRGHLVHFCHCVEPNQRKRGHLAGDEERLMDSDAQ